MQAHPQSNKAQDANFAKAVDLGKLVQSLINSDPHGRECEAAMVQAVNALKQSGRSLGELDAVAGPVFRGAVIDGKVDFSGMNLSGGDFSKASLVGTSMCGANVKGAKFCSAILGGNYAATNLRGSDIRGADFTSAEVARPGNGIPGLNLKDAKGVEQARFKGFKGSIKTNLGAAFFEAHPVGNKDIVAHHPASNASFKADGTTVTNRLDRLRGTALEKVKWPWEATDGQQPDSPAPTRATSTRENER